VPRRALGLAFRCRACGRPSCSFDVVASARRGAERARLAKKVAFWLAWTLVVPKMKLVAGGVAAVGLIMVLAVVAALVVVIAQLA
jgi:hypothetical protein